MRSNSCSATAVLLPWSVCMKMTCRLYAAAICLTSRINAVAVDSTFANASDLIAREAARKTAIPGWLTPIFMPASKLMANGIYGIDIGALVPERAVSKLDYPVLVIHGIADERVPWQQGQRVAAAAKEGSSIWLVPRVKHVDAFLEHPEEYVRKVSGYFDRQLR